jgi:single-stranded-DNA-specific exonuclease
MWLEPSPVIASDELRAAVGGHPLVAEILVRRGFTSPTSALAFLDPDRYSPSSPEALPDILIAAQRLRDAIKRGERIAVWGDFDVDGQTATALLVSALRDAGADVAYYIPNRLTESHGIRIEPLDRLLAQGVHVLLTCDTGIAAHEAINYARVRGVSVIVTDHHELPDELPQADALVNPMRLPPGHPLRQLPGVGVAFKLVQQMGLSPAAADGTEWGPYLDLVALGIVADVAEQTGDTRYLLQLGLERLRRPQRIGLRTIFETAHMDPTRLSAEHIGFGLGPRLNALGRLGNANLAVELFTTNDWGRARILAAQLEGLNNQRRLISEQIYGAAQEQITRDPSLLDASVLVLENPHWHGGVIGPVAGRLAEQYARPVVLMVTPPGQAGRGSVRSVPGCDINLALRDARVSQLLIGFGGHPGAAGLSITPENIPAFRRALSRAVDAIWDRHAALVGTRVDAYVGLDELSIELARELERLAPFGQGNPAIHLACRNLTIAGRRTFGRNGEHREVTVQDESGTTRKLTWWRGAEQEPPEGLFDLACALKSTDYMGRPVLEIEWIDARLIEMPSVQVAAPEPQIEVLDWRDAADGHQRVAALVARGDVQVWAEGGMVEGIAEHGRHALARAKTLVVWTAPPGPRELDAVLATVSPHVVALCGVTSVEDSMGPFLRRLAGLLKHDLRRRQGQVYLPALAAACGQRLATVRKGIEWLAARGQILIQTWDGDGLTIAQGAGEKQAAPELEAELRVLLSETAAYRAYFRRTDARQLVGGYSSQG